MHYLVSFYKTNRSRNIPETVVSDRKKMSVPQRGIEPGSLTFLASARPPRTHNCPLEKACPDDSHQTNNS